MDKKFVTYEAENKDMGYVISVTVEDINIDPAHKELFENFLMSVNKSINNFCNAKELGRKDANKS